MSNSERIDQLKAQAQAWRDYGNEIKAIAAELEAATEAARQAKGNNA